MAKKLLILGVVVVMLLSVLGLVGCGSTQGIQYGAYHPCSEDGVITRGAPENAWQISDNEAEYLYLKYTIIEDSDKVYFECDASGTMSARKYEVKFDKRTKILTVYMPTDFNSDTPTGEVKAHYYKKLAFGALLFANRTNSKTAFALNQNPQVQYEANNMPDISNLTEWDFNQIFNTGRAWIIENSTATEQEIDYFLRAEMVRVSESKSPFSLYYFGNSGMSSGDIQMAILHPFQAMTVKDLATAAETKALYYFDGSSMYGKNGDAFRHGYWNALMTVELGEARAKEFADAHESDTPNGVDLDMDLANNAMGRIDGATYGYLGADQMAMQIMKRVSRGYYNKIINIIYDAEKHINGGDLVSSDWVNLKLEFTCDAFYDTTDLSNNNIRIDSFGVKSNYTGSLDIPSIIKGKKVIEIDSNAFANANGISQISFSEDNIVNAFNHRMAYTNFYYTEETLDIRLIADITYTLSFDFANFTASTALNNVTTSLGVGENTFAVDLPVNLAYPNSVFGHRTIIFTPTASQLASSNKLWVRFIRTSTPQDVLVDISNIKLECTSQLQSIGNSAFANCTQLSQISIPASVTSIGSYAFSGCTGLTSITISTGTSISVNAFYGCTNLPGNWNYRPTTDDITIEGDYNGDGIDDIAMFLQNGNNAELHIWASTGASFEYDGVWNVFNNYSIERIRGRVVSGNFDGQGADDIAVFYDHSNSVQQNVTSVYVYLSNAHYFVGQEWLYFTNFEANRITDRVVSGNFKGYGADDIAVFYDHNNSVQQNVTSVYMYLSIGYTFVCQEWYSFTNFDANRVTGRVVAGNFDGLIGDDIAVFYDHSNNVQQNVTSIYLFLSFGSGLNCVEWHTYTNFDANRITGRVTAGDFNGDGKCDITVFYDHSNNVQQNVTSIYVFLSSGQSFATQEWLLFNNFDANRITGRVVAGRFKGYGADDITVLYDHNTYTSVYTYLSIGWTFVCQEW